MGGGGVAEGEGGSACSSAGQTTQGRTFRACDGAQGARAAWPACSRCRPPRHHAPPVSEADVRAGGGHAARPHRSPRCRRLPAAGAELRAEAPGSLGSRGTRRCPPAMRCLRHCWARPHDLNRGGGGGALVAAQVHSGNQSCPQAWGPLRRCPKPPSAGRLTTRPSLAPPGAAAHTASMLTLSHAPRQTHFFLQTRENVYNSVLKLFSCQANLLNLEVAVISKSLCGVGTCWEVMNSNPQLMLKHPQIHMNTKLNS